MPPGAAAQDDSEGDPVSVERPTRSDERPAFAYTGTITARRQAALSPRVGGLVMSADREAGYEAQAGETLVQLDDTLARLELEELQGELARAEAELEEAQRRLQEAEELGERNFPRTEREARASALRLAEVSVAQAETAVARQRELVARHEVPAPFHGIVARKRAEAGEWVETGSPVIDLVSLDELRLDAQVPQERIQTIRQAEQVEVRVSGIDRPIQGRLEAIGPVVETQTRTFLARVAIPDPPPELKPGMAAQGVFRPKVNGEALMISRDAIIRDEQGNTLVWVVEEREGQSRVIRREVELGATQGSRVEALRGLREGDRVVVRGNEALRDEQPVRVVEAPPAPGSAGR